MTNTEILNIALQQSAIDMNCQPADFLKSQNIVTQSSTNPQARKYLNLPFYCDLASYGNNIVASVNSEIEEVVKQYINRYPLEYCFETPNMHILDDELKKRNMRICFMAEYFLPDMNYLSLQICNYEIRILTPKEFSDLYSPEWSNALCEKRKHLDVLAAAAYDKEQLVGLAGCSADCKTMWQIGVDVLPNYRQKGIASALTSRLATEILNRDIVPFYCAAWSNIKSIRNAIKSGFRPTWLEMTAKSISFVSTLNQVTDEQQQYWE